MNASPIHKREEETTTVAPRPPLVRVDWMLLLATLGLIVCSLIAALACRRVGGLLPGRAQFFGAAVVSAG